MMILAHITSLLSSIGLLCAILLNDAAHINILHKRISCGLIIVLVVLQDDLFMFHCSELNNFLKKRWR